VDFLQSEQSTPERPALKSRDNLLREIGEILLLIVSIYTLVNLTTVRAVVDGPSMQPNFYTGQFVIVNRFAYYFGGPLRGDVVVLHDPKDPSQDFIKRIVGLPGETIEIKKGRVYANGVFLEEPYIADFCRVGCDGTWTLDNDHFFVLGDNRNHSLDSHRFGPIHRELLVGLAWIRYWPLEDFTILARPAYETISGPQSPGTR
jgi:signal peptidase I